MRILGLLLMIVGIIALAVGLSIGLPFTGIYLLGFVGTGAREAGRELALALAGTAGLSLTGVLLIWLGRVLRRRPPPSS